LTLHARRALGPTLFILGLLLAWGPLPAASAAEFSIGDFSVRMLDAEGNPENRAGARPDRIQIGFTFETEGSGTSVKDLAIEMPPGFVGNPSAVPTCPRQAHEEGEECSSESQVGNVRFGSSGEPLPIYLLEPKAGQMIAFTSKVGLQIPFQMKLRPDDFGITMEADDLAEGTPSEEQVELWGIPADHQQPPAAPPRPFLTVPPECGPLAFTLRARSREEGAAWLSAVAEVGPLVGCEGLRFAPQLSLQLGNPVADSPTGVRMVMSKPEEEGELASSQMKDVTVELPSGLTVSPGGAVGLALCSDAQFGLSSESTPSCPSASKVGTVQLTSAMLSEPLAGTIYLGEPLGEERFRFFIVAPGFGVNLKFVTGLQPDSATGRLATTLRDLPPVAISQIAMNLNGGSTGLLASPLACGPAQGEASFVPFGGGPGIAATSTVAIASALPGLTCPGPLPFGPQLLISATSHRAGAPSALSTTLRRQGGEALPSRFTLTLPAGLSASLGSIQACPDSAAVAGSCPATSRLGSVQLEVGSGPVPAVLSGGIYLAGPYHHAPFSMVMTIPATLGPFNLGTVAFRAAMQIDGRSGRVTIASDSLPSVVDGVPIRLQALSLSLDRAGFVRNPTFCGPHALDGSLESSEGATATLSSPYRVSGCKRLGFKPRLRVALSTGRRPHRHEQVGLRVSAHFRRADASLRSLFVSMPPALKLGIGKLREICSRPDARRNLCPPGAKVGTAQAHTPLLGKKALTGAVYVVQPRDDGEPDIWVVLSGDGVKLAIHGATENEHGRFVTRLGGLPDMPLSDFTMRLGSPGNSLLSLDANPCSGDRAHRLEAELRAGGQNGAKRSSRVAIADGASCRSAGPG
jgi:hypothetical protein